MSDTKIILLAAASLLCLAIFGGALVGSGLAIGFLTATAFAVLALKSRIIRLFARRFPLLADLLATACGYLLFPAGVTAFVAAGVVALLITILIAVDRKLNPEAHAPREETITSQMSKARSGVGDLLGRVQPR